MKKIGILYHPMVEATLHKAKQLQDFLGAQVDAAWLCSAWEGTQISAQLDDTDLLLSVGGDGTILRSAQAAALRNIPVTGINLGNLGFMTELGADEAVEKLPSLLAGEGWIDERAMLEAELRAPDGQTQSFHALNDVVIARGAIARLIRVEVSLDEQRLTTYRADGVIVATATGSTGYALAAGGPILYPQSHDQLLLPITPHLSPAHALVMSPQTVIRLRVMAIHEATLSIDGHVNQPLADGAQITVKHSPHKTRFLRIHPQDSFYRTLEAKLKGKQ
jgi:NAD+ kinase